MDAMNAVLSGAKEPTRSSPAVKTEKTTEGEGVNTEVGGAVLTNGIAAALAKVKAEEERVAKFFVI